MVTTQSHDDDFEEVERGIDWLERLENLKARQDREAALRETVEYVNRLRNALVLLSDAVGAEQIAELYGKEVADLIDGIRKADASDPWLEYLRPRPYGALTRSITRP